MNICLLVHDSRWIYSWWKSECWFLHEVDGQGDNGFSDLYDDVDLVVMGWNTLRWLLDNDVHENPYANKKVIVISFKPVKTELKDVSL